MKKSAKLTKQDVHELYQQFLGRPPESQNTILYHLQANQSRLQMILSLQKCAEYKQRRRKVENSLGKPIGHKFRQWRQWNNAACATGITALSFQEYLATRLSPPMRILSMLMPEELALLYSIARQSFKGNGLIIDAGPLLGLTTYMLASGLRDNTSLRLEDRPYIYSFDLFRKEGGYATYFTSLEHSCITSNLLYEFMKLNSEFLKFICPHQGDFLTWAWPNEAKIEILFLDLAKSWALNQHAVNFLFPALIPGEATVIQQDYVHFNEYWVAITMEFFGEYFTCLGFVRGGTAVFKLDKPIPVEKLQVNLANLPYQYKMNLLQKATEKAPPTVKEILKCAKAKCALDNNDFETAYNHLSSVDCEVCGNDPDEDFSFTIKSNRDQVLRKIKEEEICRDHPLSARI